MGTGQDLINFINNNEWLKLSPMKYVFLELLKRGLINPSYIIDAYTQILEDRCDKYKCHYEDSCVSAMQLFNGNFKGEDYELAKKRFLYNTSFSKCFPNMIGNELTEEEKDNWRKFFKTTYGFDPEIE